MSSDEQLGEDDHGTAKPSSEHNDDRVESDDEDDDTDSNASSEYEVVGDEFERIEGADRACFFEGENLEQASTSSWWR